MRNADRHCYLSFQSALRRTEISAEKQRIAGREIARYSLIVDYLAKWDVMGGNEQFQRSGSAFVTRHAKVAR